MVTPFCCCATGFTTRCQRSANGSFSFRSLEAFILLPVPLSSLCCAEPVLFSQVVTALNMISQRTLRALYISTQRRTSAALALLDMRAQQCLQHTEDGTLACCAFANDSDRKPALCAPRVLPVPEDRPYPSEPQNSLILRMTLLEPACRCALEKPSLAVPCRRELTIETRVKESRRASRR